MSDGRCRVFHMTYLYFDERYVRAHTTSALLISSMMCTALPLYIAETVRSTNRFTSPSAFATASRASPRRPWRPQRLALPFARASAAFSSFASRRLAASRSLASRARNRSLALSSGAPRAVLGQRQNGRLARRRQTPQLLYVGARAHPAGAGEQRARTVLMTCPRRAERGTRGARADRPGQTRGTRGPRTRGRVDKSRRASRHRSRSRATR